jgi:hypothetical protein
MATVDPELERQLIDAPEGHSVEAVFRLKPPDSVTTAAAPEETERLAHELLKRAKESSGQTEDGMNVFRYLGSFAVAARPEFLRTLMSQPEVATVVANRKSGSVGVIPPAGKRSATLKDVRTTPKSLRPKRKPARRPAR